MLFELCNHSPIMNAIKIFISEKITLILKSDFNDLSSFILSLSNNTSKINLVLFDKSRCFDVSLIVKSFS